MPKTTTMSMKHHLGSIYWAQVQRCKKKGFDPPEYSLDEFRDAFINTDRYKELWDAYKKSGCKRLLSPSFDRKDESKGYSFDNITLMTWGENKAKGHRDLRKGKIIHGNNPQKPIMRIDEDGNKTKYVSVSQAARITGIRRTAISNALCGVCKTCAGYVWKYAT